MASQKRFIEECFEFVKFKKEDIERSIPEVFERIVHRYSDRIAVKVKDETVIYSLLNQKANHIARSILAMQQHGNEPISMILEPGAILLAAILGILKAGKFYVPIDPSNPLSRNQQIMGDSGANVLLTNNRNLHLARKLAPEVEHLINVDEIDFNPPAANPCLPISSDDLAYVIYTSGSTGKPKGVMQNHRNVLHKVMGYTNTFRVCCNDRLVLIYSPGAGGSVRDIFTALLTGATLYPLNIRQDDFFHLRSLLNDDRITIYNSAATIFRHFIEILPRQYNFPYLRLIRLGSETIRKRDVELYKRRFSDNCWVAVQLGTTEISPIRQFLVDKKTRVENSTVPVGFAVEGTDVLLLDDHGRNVDIGDIGEIAVSSRFLSPGYWRNTKRTNKVFLPSHENGGERVYLTGDLGRMLPNGCLLHMGRKDFQVKIRGNRVEPAEIEMALFDFGWVKEVVVVACKDQSNVQYLVAYIVPNNQPAPSTDIIQHTLKEKLPDFMIPSAFVFLDALPQTSTGKVDRLALPAIDQIKSQEERQIIPPRTQVETCIVNIWSEVFSVKQVSIYDDFFKLGGHSLLAIQVVSRVRDAFEVEMSIQSLFDAPTVAGLAEIITKDVNLKNQQVPPVLPVSSTKEPPLSFAQQGIWVFNQLNLDEVAYNSKLVLHLAGSLNFDALQFALNHIICRHESLRTTFKVKDGKPFQNILSQFSIEIPLIDLRSLPAARRELEAFSILKQKAQIPYDLEKGPLLRAFVLCLAKEEHILLVSMHHIIFDGWSKGVFLKEFSECYNSFLHDRAPNLPRLSVRYTDFSEWQRGWLQRDVLDRQLSYWKRQLQDPPLFNFPFSKPRPRIQTYNGLKFPINLSEGLTEKIKFFCRQEKVTLFMTLLAVFKVLLFRYSAQGDLLIGTPIANRNRKELEGLIGVFINTLAIRTKVSGNLSFKEFLHHVRSVSLEAFEHRDLPVDKIVEGLRIERDLSRHPLFQIIFVLQNDPYSKLELDNLKLETMDINTNTALLDLILELSEKQGVLQGWFKYNRDLFESDYIERMVLHYKNLLEEIVTNPERKLSELSMLTKVERHQLLIDWNSRHADYSVITCIHELFEEQVAKSPDADAILYEEQRLTYGELNQKANQLAHYLRNQNVGPEVLVGICMERSPEMIIAILAILKAGGAYVPLDPQYPKERLAFMLEDSAISVILTQSWLQNGLPNYSVYTISLDTQWDRIGRFNHENPLRKSTNSNAVYVIYTSGSTGKPKGVVVEHKTLVNYIKAAICQYEIETSDRILQFSSISFDASVEEIFCSLVKGATLVLRTKEMLHSVRNFFSKCEEWEITILGLPTAYWHRIVNNLVIEEPSIPDSIRLVVIGGEEANRECLLQWDEYVGTDVKILNTYGPTEATVVATVCDLSPTQNVAIGRAISNVSTYILDQYLNPVPIGISGELFIGGAGLARGYLNRPQLTAEKFIPDPFSKKPKARLYKTGDQARYLPDGDIKFMGRIDHQVKVRGFRIELGEIEAVLLANSLVYSSVVIARDDHAGSNQLVAYIVPSSDNSPTPRELHSFLAARLPNYMVPAHFIVIEALPYTHNGKVDRKILPEPGEDSLVRQSFVAPRTEIERSLASIWGHVLHVKQVGIHDNFFELGGHSLTATQLASRIRDLFDMEIPLRVLFERPTIGDQSEYIDSQYKDDKPIESTGRIVVNSREKFTF